MKKPYCNFELSILDMKPQDVITASGEFEPDVNGDDLYFME